MKNRIIFILFTIIFSVSLFAKEAELLTVAEKSNYKLTSTHAEVLDFITQLQKEFKHIKVENIATSEYGKNIPMIMLANPMPKSPQDLINDDRMVVYIQANIHAGEVEGKEASLRLARDLLQEKKDELFKKLIIIIVPDLNPDGNDQISEKNRTNQNGPAAVGLRQNGQHLDINRDGIKVETPELKGLLNYIFNKWDPTLTVDCHTTNGSFHEETVTTAWMVNPNGDRSLINYMRDKMMPGVTSQLRDKYKIGNCYYGNFEDRTNIESDWIYHAVEPRYITNYIGLRNRFAILNENYVYANYKSRVEGCYYLLKSILEYSYNYAGEMKLAVQQADEKSIQRGLNPVKDSIAIEYERKATPQKMTIKAISLEYYTDEEGRRRYRPGNDRRTVQLNYMADYYPAKQIQLPFAYILNIANKKVLENLKNHGIKIEQLKEDISLSVEEFHFDEIKPEERINQGHYLNNIKGKFETIEKEFTEGTYIIRTSQKLGNLVAYLLEPQSEDSLLKWNFFDRYLMPQWGNYYFPYPVYKIMAPVDIKSNPLF